MPRWGGFTPTYSPHTCARARTQALPTQMPTRRRAGWGRIFESGETVSVQLPRGLSSLDGEKDRWRGERLAHYGSQDPSGQAPHRIPPHRQPGRIRWPPSDSRRTGWRLEARCYGHRRFEGETQASAIVWQRAQVLGKHSCPQTPVGNCHPKATRRLAAVRSARPADTCYLHCGDGELGATALGAGGRAGAYRCPDRAVQTGRRGRRDPPAPPAADRETEGPGQGVTRPKCAPHAWRSLPPNKPLHGIPEHPAPALPPESWAPGGRVQAQSRQGGRTGEPRGWVLDGCGPGPSPLKSYRTCQSLPFRVRIVLCCVVLCCVVFTLSSR